MDYIIYFVPLVFLIILSLIDIKTFNLKEGAIPSALTTLFICVSLILGMNVIIGIMAFLIGMIMVDLDLFAGVPDWKVFIASGLVLPSLYHVIMFGVLTCFIAIFYKLILKKYYKEIPFIPVIMISYLGTVGLILL